MPIESKNKDRNNKLENSGVAFGSYNFVGATSTYIYVPVCTGRPDKKVWGNSLGLELPANLLFIHLKRQNTALMIVVSYSLRISSFNLALGSKKIK